jgi:hypothetical protein
MNNSSILGPEQFKLIAELSYHPGFLLLLDYLQHHLDDLTDQLGEVEDPVSSVEKLRYWQAYRRILRDLQTQPKNFETQLTPDEKQQAEFLDVTHLRQRMFR